LLQRKAYLPDRFDLIWLKTQNSAKSFRWRMNIARKKSAQHWKERTDENGKAAREKESPAG